MIYIIGIVITFFLSFLLLTKKKKTLADKILVGWLLMILVHLILFSVIASNEYLKFSCLLGLEIPLPLLHGPFLFLYTKALTGKSRSFRKMTFHFIPYLIGFISTLPFLFLRQEEKIFVYQNEGLEYDVLTSIILLGIIISGITYTVLTLDALWKHKKLVKHNFSYTERVNLKWLYRLTIGLSFIWILVLFADDKFIFSSVVLFVVFIGYYGIKQVGIFTNQPPQELATVSDFPVKDNMSIVSSGKAKYDKSSLADDVFLDIHRRLGMLMKEKKLYLTPELTLTMVSEELDVHPNTLSQVINRAEQKNFFDYINTLRVEEFKEKVSQPDNQKYTLLSLAHECGFNSKTSFNRNFKNLTGKSPSEYLNESKTRLS